MDSTSRRDFVHQHRGLRPACVVAVVLYGLARASGQDGPLPHCANLEYDRDNPSAIGRDFYSDMFLTGAYTPNADRCCVQFRDFL